MLEGRSGRRGLAIATVYLGLILIPIAIGAVLVPPIVTEAQNLADKVPEYAQDLREFAQENRQLRELEEDYDITGKLQEEAEKLPSKLGGAAGVLSDIGLGHRQLAVRRHHDPDPEHLHGRQRPPMGGGAPSAAGRRPSSEMLRRTVHGHRARPSAATAPARSGRRRSPASLSFVVLSILGVPYAAALALIIFLLDLVPLVGATLGAIVVGIVTLFNDFPTDTRDLGRVVDRLPADREHGHPAAHPGRDGQRRSRSWS